jgi:hypothetical protein
VEAKNAARVEGIAGAGTVEVGSAFSGCRLRRRHCWRCPPTHTSR